MKLRTWQYAGLILAAVLTFGACMEQETGSTQTGAPETQAQQDEVSDTFEYKLAVVHKGGFVAEDDPLVGRFGRLLDSLTRKCRNGRQGVSDIGVRAQQVLEERGVSLSVLEVMEAIDGSMPEEASGLDCTEIAAILITLIVSGD